MNTDTIVLLKRNVSVQTDTYAKVHDKIPPQEKNND